MILVTSHQSIVAVLASSPATQPDFSSSVDVYSGATRTGARQLHGTLDGTNQIQVVENPSGTEHRRVESLTISNRHNAGIVCTVSLKDGSTAPRVIVECEIGVDETLEWNGTKWSIFPEITSGSGTGDVVGPAIGTATDNAVARFDGTTGKLIQNSVVIADDSGNVSGIVDLAATGTSTLANVTITGTLVYNAFTAKGELIASTADNTPGILAAAAYDYHVLTSRTSTGTGLAWGHRAHLWHSEIVDAAAHHSSATESGVLYDTSAIPTAYINEAGTTIRVYVAGVASTTGSPGLTCRIKFNDGSTSQVIGTPSGGSPGSSVTNVMCQWEGQYTVRTTGATGTIDGWQKGTAGGTTAQNSRAEGTITLDLTANPVVEVTLTWTVASASNTATLTHFTVEIIKP